MRKRILFFSFIFALLFLTFFLNVIKAEDLLSEEGLMNLEGKWDYLGKEWKTMLLENKYTGAVNTFLTSISIFFEVVFGIPYTLSFVFLFTIILWVFILFMIINAMSLVSIFSKWVSSLMAIGFMILIAQSGALKIPVNWFVWWFFGQKEWWMKLIIGLGALFVLVLLLMFTSNLAKQAKLARIKNKEEMDRIKLDTGAKVGEALSKSISES